MKSSKKERTSPISRRSIPEPSSAKKGGNMGWVQTKMFSADIQEGFYKAQKGDRLGPFYSEDGAALIEFRGLKRANIFP